MAQKTNREVLNEKLAVLQDKLLTANLKSNPEAAIVAGLVESIKDVERQLASDDPKLDDLFEKPKFNWGAVG